MKLTVIFALVMLAAQQKSPMFSSESFGRQRPVAGREPVVTNRGGEDPDGPIEPDPVIALPDPDAPPTEPDPAFPAFGGEHLTWDYEAESHDVVASLRFFAYVDDEGPVELADVVCADERGDAGFECAAPLPTLSRGRHVISVSAVRDGDPPIEGPLSTPLLVDMRSGSGQSVRRSSSRADVVGPLPVARGLGDVTGIASAEDGRIFLAERAGRILVLRPGLTIPAPAIALADVITGSGRGLLGIALDSQFEESQVVFVAYTTSAGLRLARLTVAGDRLVSHTVLAEGLPIADEWPSAALGIGPDRQLYVALDDGGDPRHVGDAGSFSGKILRFNLDGTATLGELRTPVYSVGLNHPSSIAVRDAPGRIWLTGTNRNGVGRLREVTTTNQSVAGREFGLATTGTPFMANPGGRSPSEAADIVVTGIGDGLLRVHPDQTNAALSTSWFRERGVTAVTAMGDAPGSIYVVAAGQLFRFDDRR